MSILASLYWIFSKTRKDPSGEMLARTIFRRHFSAVDTVADIDLQEPASLLVKLLTTLCHLQDGALVLLVAQ